MARKHTKFLALSVLAASHSAIALGQTSGTWAVDVGTAGGSWSTGSNWSGGVAPDNGGTATFNTLPTFTSAPLSIFQDLPTVTLNGIDFGTQITYQLRAPTASGNTLTLAGPASVTTPIPSINGLSITTFGQFLDLPIAGSVGLTKNGPGTVSLWRNTNTYTGGTTVNDGVLVLRQIGDAGLGDASGGVTFDGGTIRVTTTAWTSSRAITLLAGGGSIEATTTGATTFNGSIAGAGDLNKTGSRGLNLLAGNSFNGATNILAGSIGLAGNGALSGTSSLSIRDSLVIDNAATNNTNRVNDAATVTLDGAAITLIGNTTAASSESFGATSFARGTSFLTVTPGTGQNAALAFGETTRAAGAGAFIRGTGLGSGSGARVTFANAQPLVGGGGADGTTTVSILPWAYGNTAAAASFNTATNSLLTYGANGVRPLDIATEHTTAITSGTSTDDNVRITAAQTVAADTTINSLTIAAATSVSGAGELAVNSGAILNLVNGASISTPLSSGTREYVIQSPASITFAGALRGSGGMTKLGSGVATFSAANEYTGVTTIAGGTAALVSSVPASGNGPFGSDSSTIVLSPAGVGTGNTTARIVYAGVGPASFDRDLNVTGRIATGNAATIPGFGVSTANTFTMNGDITLDGSPLGLTGTTGSTLVLAGDIIGDGGPVTDAATGSGTIRLAGNNSFEGGIEMSGATWEVASNTAFGNGGLIKTVQTSGTPTILAVGAPRTISNPTVSLAFSSTYWTIGGAQDLTFTGSINLSGSFSHVINNASLTTYAGVVHTGGFTKNGLGILAFSGNNIYSGTGTVNAGTLRAAHANALGTPEAPTLVADGAALELDGALTSEPVTIRGMGVAAQGALSSIGGANSVATVTVPAGALTNVTIGSSLKTGPVDVAAGQLLTKTGNGVLSIERIRGGGLAIATGKVAVVGARSNDRTSNVTSLVVPLTGNIQLDLGANDLVYEYTATSPLATVQAAIASGYDGGTWAGPGITSAAALATPGTALGYGETAVALGAGSHMFSGQTVDDTSVLIRYTYAGDANLDGSVNLDDFTALAAAFGTPATTWTSGDFNYNAVTNLDDFTALAANFGLTLAADTARAAVPEPTLGALVVAAMIGLRRRRSSK